MVAEPGGTWASSPTLPQRDQLLAEATELLCGRPLMAAWLALSAQPARLLDIGCKAGWLLDELSRRGGAELLVGIDRDVSHVDQPASSAPYAVLGADARRLPFAEASFDAVSMFDVIEHLPKSAEEGVLAEAARVLRPGGLLLLSTPADWWLGTLLDPQRWILGHRHYPRGQIVALVRAAGFELELVTTRGGWADVVALPLLYATSRLGVRMPGAGWLGPLANEQYAREGRYTHFLVARKTGAIGGPRLRSSGAVASASPR